jgi:hypothetical protein
VLQGIIERDQIVFQKCRTRNIPVVMVTSGGYQRHTARIIADSILNLRALGLISCDAAEAASGPPSECGYTAWHLCCEIAWLSVLYGRITVVYVVAQQ